MSGQAARHSFAGRTPEALLDRSDSKNPATTCRGQTGKGLPCRRAIASPANKRRRASGGGEAPGAEYYCHQHKDQARNLDQSPAGGGQSNLFPLQKRDSVDTLVQRLGVGGVNSDLGTVAGGRLPKKSEDTDGRPEGRYAVGSPAPPQRRKSEDKKKKSGFGSLLCCFRSEPDEIVRRRRRSDNARPPPQSHRLPPSTASRLQAAPRPPMSSTRPPSAPANRPVELPHRPSPSHRTSSTPDLLALIPKNLTAQTTAALLTELGKPPNPKDEEGYIYIFWLTPQQKAAPEESTARSLLNPDSSALPNRSRIISDVMSEYSVEDEKSRSFNAPQQAGKKTILLKIGRANNVHRRMNEWQRQCGYSLTLVRFYPYVSAAALASATPSPARTPNRQSAQSPRFPDPSRLASGNSTPTTNRRESGVVRKVPCVKRVERLIHLELAERQVKNSCQECGREHREWFGVDASERGVKDVDAVVKRWVEWGERQA